MSSEAAPRVLIVDDDCAIREGLAEVFARAGFAAFTAPDARTMDRLLGEQGADLVVLDLMMPGEDGLSACRRLAGKGWPPVILLSALGDDFSSDLLNPRECDVTVLFCDLRGFSLRAEESAGDLLGLACSLYFVWYGWTVLAASYRSGAITIKTLVTPEWWLLAPLPVAFLLLAAEFVFRMHRLSRGPRAPRADAVSAS